MTDSAPKAARQIEHQLRCTFQCTGRRLFWPDQFLRAEIAKPAVVAEAMKLLVDSGKLIEEATIFCPDGHKIWSGKTVEMPSIEELYCDSCHPYSPDPDRTMVEARYRIADDWAEEIAGEADAAQKKTTAL